MRDAEATQRRLLDAARTEFAAHGIAGARVDRIAHAARSNKAQIYNYFGNKDALFDAVFSDVVAQVVTTAPLNVEDLPDYAVRLAKGYDADPDVMRLATWHRLERGASPLVQAAVTSNAAKIDTLARAQANGTIASRLPAGVLLALLLQIAAVWAELPEELSEAMGPVDAGSRYAAVRDAVAALLTRG